MAEYKAWLNPLKCVGLDLAHGLAAAPATEGQLFDYLFSPGAEHGAASFIRRLEDLPDVLQVVPSEPNILEKLVWPLRCARGNFALGNYVACIALCGMVCEMLAILLWEISTPRVRAVSLGTSVEADGDAVFGDGGFERLGQERRIPVLRALGLIDAAAEQAFGRVRLLRKRYLHFLSHDHARGEEDAKQAFADAAHVVAFVVGPTDVREGVVFLRKELSEYLAREGVLVEEPA